MIRMLEFLVSLPVQGVLGLGALLSGAIILYLSSKMGKKDERIQYIDLKGTNVVLWTFSIMILVLFLLNPSDTEVYRKFMLDSVFFAVIVGGGYSIYQYKKY